MRLVVGDLASLSAVRALADQVPDRLDVLVNNAGIGFAGGREESDDGYELRFAVNYLAGFLLASLLRDASTRRRRRGSSTSPPPASRRSTSTTSCSSDGYDGARAYCQSKLAQIMHAFDLAEELAAAASPRRRCTRRPTWTTKMVIDAGVTPASTVQEGLEATGAWSPIRRSTASAALYFNGTREARADAQAYDLDARRRLRELSQRLVEV